MECARMEFNEIPQGLGHYYHVFSSWTHDDLGQAGDLRIIKQDDSRTDLVLTLSASALRRSAGRGN